MNGTHTISGQFVDLFERAVYPATVTVSNGKIERVTKVAKAEEQYILPGFVDAHVHIESSMLVPTAFAQLAVRHGTVATVSDPHEIANVCGMEGVQYMIDNSRHSPFKFFFGAPSCVPATFFETSGAVLDAAAVEQLLEMDEIWYLSEMMNYPGVLHKDPEVMAKIDAAKKKGKPIDGHAPGLKGAQAAHYAAAGISTDHESFTLEEALDKVKAGMHCLIREGSAAKNFDALIEIIREHPNMVMFCSDDKHPDELLTHHINDHVRRAVRKGYDLFNVLRAASVNPVQHYQLPVGLLRPGDPADFIVVNNLVDFETKATFIDGILVSSDGKSLLPDVPVARLNNFKAAPLKAFQLRVRAERPLEKIRVIEAIEGQLVTKETVVVASVENGELVAEVANDVLKIVVMNRYQKESIPAVAFIRNFGLKKGALASTVAHDCHNLIAVGADDASIAAAINALIQVQGGVAVATGPNQVDCLPLPVAGLMSDQNGAEVAKAYAALDAKAKALGTSLKAPFMTLSFMALLVIPSLKLSDKGLFNGETFRFTSLLIP